MVSRRLDVVSYLGSQVLFQNMPEAELQRIAAASIVRRLQEVPRSLQPAIPAKASTWWSMAWSSFMPRVLKGMRR